MNKFKTSLNGYNKQEVNKFVNDVSHEYESMLNNLKNRDQEIKSLKDKLVQYQNMENTLNRALLVAEDASNQIKRVARDESKSIIDDARRNASRIVNEFPKDLLIFSPLILINPQCDQQFAKCLPV